MATAPVIDFGSFSSDAGEGWAQSEVTKSRRFEGIVGSSVRELQNVIERSVVLSNGPELNVSLPQAGSMSASRALHGPAARVSATLERGRILQVLKEADGQLGGTDGAAARLGLKRTTLHSRMRKHKIARQFW